MPIQSRIAASAFLMTSCLLSPVGVANDISTRIYGGQDAAPADWPWMTGMNIQFSDGSGGFCGSQLLSPDWVLTAAHCLVPEIGIEATSVEFFYSAPNIPMPGLMIDEVSDNILIHELYQADDIRLGHDIALVRVARAPSLAVFPDLADAATVTQLEALPAARRDDAMIALGWGETNPVTSGLSGPLQQVSLDYITR